MSVRFWRRVLAVLGCFCVLSSAERVARGEDIEPTGPVTTSDAQPTSTNSRETSLILRELGKSEAASAHYLTTEEYDFRVVEFTRQKITVSCLKRQSSDPWNENEYWYLTFEAPSGEQFALKDYKDDTFTLSPSPRLMVTRGALWRHSEYASPFVGSFSITELSLNDQGQVASIRINFAAYAKGEPWAQVEFPLLGELRLNADVSQDPPNRPPRISAGQPQYLSGRRWTYLAGSFDDDLLPAGNPLSVKWQVVSGPKPTPIFNGSDPTTAVSPNAPLSFSVPGVYVVRYTASDGEYTVSDDVTIVVGSAAATYHGYVTEKQVIIGTFHVSLLRSGKFTGSIKVGKDRLPVRGEAGSFSSSHFEGHISLPNRTSVSMAFNLLPSGSKIEGWFSLGSRFFFLVATPRSDPFLRISRQASPFAAAYTWITEIPQDNTGPQGYSFGTAKVSRNGAVRFIGHLSHGRAISYGGFIGLDGWAPLFWTIPQVEQFAGPVQFATSANGPHFGASVQWIQNWGPNSVGFEDGFRFIAKLVGSRYTPPRSGTNLLTQTAEPVTLHAHSFVPSWPGERKDELTLRTKNTFASSNGFTLKANPRTGLFQGTLIDPSGKKRSFGGAILQHAHAGGGSLSANGEVGAVLIQAE